MRCHFIYGVSCRWNYRNRSSVWLQDGAGLRPGPSLSVIEGSTTSLLLRNLDRGIDHAVNKGTSSLERLMLDKGALRLLANSVGSDMVGGRKDVTGSDKIVGANGVGGALVVLRL